MSRWSFVGGFGGLALAFGLGIWLAPNAPPLVVFMVIFGGLTLGLVLGQIAGALTEYDR